MSTEQHRDLSEVVDDAADRAAEVAGDAADRAAEASADVQRHPLYRWMVTIGLCCYGVVHLLLAWLAVQVVRGRNVDASNQGSLTAIAALPAGRLLIALIGAGMAALTLWMVLETAFGYPWLEGRSRLVRRIACFFRAATYASIAWAALVLTVGSRIEEGDESARATTNTLMSLPGGGWLLVVVAIGIAIAAADQVQRGARRSFVRYDLQSPLPRWAEHLGVVGWIAKGIVLAVVAVLMVVAAVRHDARRAGGLDMALLTLRNQAYGRVLLSLVAAGLACFGLYCFIWAPRARHDASPDKDPR